MDILDPERSHCRGASVLKQLLTHLEFHLNCILIRHCTLLRDVCLWLDSAFVETKDMVCFIVPCSRNGQMCELGENYHNVFRMLAKIWLLFFWGGVAFGYFFFAGARIRSK